MTNYQACGRIYHIKSDSLESFTAKEQDKKLMGDDKAPAVKGNGLSGLLSHYDSDSEPEDVTTKLDEKVDDFLQEIEQLSSTASIPEKPKEPEKKIAPATSSSSHQWQELYDESTGYPYYWNVDTNVVTWEMPKEYKEWLESKTVVKNEPDDPPPTYDPPPKCESPSEKPKVDPKKTKDVPKKWIKKKKVENSESDEEKIVMITSFSESSSSDDETDKSKLDDTESTDTSKEESNVVMGPHIEDIPIEHKTGIVEDVHVKKVEDFKDENIDETILLSRLRTKAKVRQEHMMEIKDIKVTPSLSLVAGYGDDSDVDDQEERAPPAVEPPVETESILFPATKPIDIKQFEVAEKAPVEATTSPLVDTKVFKRKRRLGIELDVLPSKNGKKNKVELAADGGKKGFGFQEREEMEKSNTFIKKTISFIKADVLNPKTVVTSSEMKCTGEESYEDYDQIKGVVSEKVHFLCEGKGEVSHVQVMLIQLQTLESAYKEGGLSLRYLYEWLRGTSAELGKLEREAAPSGWCCQWDRWNKRYYYRNDQTGDTQWEYPQHDIVGGGEAMDICTTPPPPDEPAPPPPPTIAEPIPPPPPDISEDAGIPSPPSPPAIRNEKKKRKKDPIPDVPVREPTPPKLSLDEPLPPGVDAPELPYVVALPDLVVPDEIVDTHRQSFGTELDSFYSDIAMLEASAAPLPVPAPSVSVVEVPIVEAVPAVDTHTENKDNKTKKKKKVKIGKGLTMKKKAVSTLVEKWKKVQNDYI